MGTSGLHLRSSTIPGRILGKLLYLYLRLTAAEKGKTFHVPHRGMQKESLLNVG